MKTQKRLNWIFLVVLCIVIFLTVFSSSLPDGLEWVSEKLGFAQKEKTIYSAPAEDYTISEKLSSGLNQIFSGFLGILVVTGIVFIIYWFRKTFKKNSDINNEA